MIVCQTGAARRAVLRSTTLRRRWQSSSSSPSAEPPQGDPPSPHTRLANLALASALLGFCGFVFTYSMNAVGKADADDPLARLQAEAQEAKDSREKSHARRLTVEEVAALESGMTTQQENGGGRSEIAALEEEANLKIFGKENGDNGEVSNKKKKPWWRFGF